MKPLVCLLLLLLAGCSTTPPHPPSACRDHFGRLDRAVAAAGVRDHGTNPVAGFPYLRVDRLLASFADEVETPERFAAWVERLARLDREARAVELQNLTAEARQALPPPHSATALLAEGDRCRDELIRLDLASTAGRQRLQRGAQVPDDYVTGWRVAGLYPLTALFVRAGVSRWHREVHESYARPLEVLASNHLLTTWNPPVKGRLGREAVAALLAASRQNPLGIPEPDSAQREALFATFAPQWRIETRDGNDLPGHPRWTASGPVVATERPTLFRHLSHTRLDDQVLLQLNYILWFPARPSAGEGLDLYAGALDGITLRITLGNDGQPLLYDTIHNCGCYHKFFPVAPLLPRSTTLQLPEPPLVPQLIASAGEVPVVYVSSRAHYVERMDFAPAAGGESYLWGDYRQLLTLPQEGGGRRSLFGEHGLVTASARPERFLLWPMGVRSPGAMRQWGRHPTAFVGRRHFDDPFLIETLFRYGAESPP